MAVAIEELHRVPTPIRAERVKATNTGNAIFIRLGHRTQSKPPGRKAN